MRCWGPDELNCFVLVGVFEPLWEAFAPLKVRPPFWELLDMRLSERVGVYLSAVLLNAALLAFGWVLVHQGAVHKVLMGRAEIRDAIVERATEPIWFWISVGFDALIGILLLAGGLYGFWLTFWRKPPSRGEEPLD